MREDAEGSFDQDVRVLADFGVEHFRVVVHPADGATGKHVVDYARCERKLIMEKAENVRYRKQAGN